MIIVHGTFPIRNEVREEALRAARNMAVASRCESGCISYEFYESLNEPDKLLLFQEWDSLDALKEHYQTDHMEVFLKKLPWLLSGEISTRRYLVQANEEHEEVEIPVNEDSSGERIVH